MFGMHATQLLRIDDYRELLTTIIENKKQLQAGISYGQLADRVGVQRSYFSQVLKGKADLNQDQLYALSQELGLTAAQSAYVAHLLEIARCRHPGRQAELIRRRDRMRKKMVSAERSLERESTSPDHAATAEFYGDPLCPIVHMFMNIPEYRKHPELIAKKLRITKRDLANTLNVLEKCGILRVERGQYTLLQPNLHLSKDSYLSRIHATAFRVLAANYQQRRDSETDCFFTSTFSADEAAKVEIRARFLEFLAWVGKRVEKAADRGVYHFNFDLFEIR